MKITKRLPGSQYVSSVSDSTSIDLSVSGLGALSAVLILSAAAADAGNQLVSLDLHADGLRAQLSNERIQDGAFGIIADTNSLDLTYDDAGNSFYGDVRISSNVADVSNTIVALSIESTGVVGLRAQILNTNITGLFSSANTAISYSAGVITFNVGNVSHAGLANLTSSDDHTQYALLAGRSSGQTLKGDTASGGNLTLMSTNHATKGKILFGTSGYDEVNNWLGIGSATPVVALDVVGGFATRHGTDIATSGTLTDVATAGLSLLRFTGASQIGSFANPVDGKWLVLCNATGAVLTLKNDSGGTAANRVYTGSGADIVMQDKTAITLIYDSQASRWRVAGHSGGISGGGFAGGYAVLAVASLSAAGTIAITAGVQRQIVNIQGNGGAVTTNTTTAITAGTVDGQEVLVTGQSDTNTVTISSAANVRMNGSAVLAQGDSISFYWDATNSVWQEKGRNH